MLGGKLGTALAPGQKTRSVNDITGTVSQTEPPIQQDGTAAHPYSDASQGNNRREHHPLTASPFRPVAATHTAAPPKLFVMPGDDHLPSPTLAWHLRLEL
jgi:hypothetical protein